MFSKMWIHNLGGEGYINIYWGSIEQYWEHIGYITWGSLETYPGELWNHEVLNFTNNINMQENEYNKLARFWGCQETKYRMI